MDNKLQELRDWILTELEPVVDEYERAKKTRYILTTNITEDNKILKSVLITGASIVEKIDAMMGATNE